MGGAMMGKLNARELGLSGATVEHCWPTQQRIHDDGNLLSVCEKKIGSEAYFSYKLKSAARHITVAQLSR